MFINSTLNRSFLLVSVLTLLLFWVLGSMFLGMQSSDGVVRLSLMYLGITCLAGIFATYATRGENTFLNGTILSVLATAGTLAGLAGSALPLPIFVLIIYAGSYAITAIFLSD